MSKTNYQRYKSQKATAKQRGIGFNLTYEEWLNIWESSGKLDQYGYYVMSRVGDTGPYEVGNVFIQKRSENSKEPSLELPVVWTLKEIEDCIELYRKGWTLADISKIVNRTPVAIEIKISRNLPIQERQYLNNSHAS